jgi:hypothetical protein
MATELEQLKADHAALAERIRQLEGKAPPKPAPVIEEGARVFYPPPACGAFVMPTDAELRALIAVVLRAYPTLRPRERRGQDFEDAEREYFRGFKLAFRGLAAITRADAVSYREAATFWIDETENVLRLLGLSVDFNDAWLAALIAHADIPFTDFTVDGGERAFGLRLGGGERMATDKWRKVLAGEVPKPVPSRRLQDLRPSPARIFGGPVY